MIDNGTPAPELVGATWRKASYSNSKGNCAELARVSDGRVAIRQNTDPDGPALVIGRSDFAGFVAEAKSGGLDDLLLPA